MNDEPHIEYSVDTIQVALTLGEFCSYQLVFVVAPILRLITIDGKLKWSVR